MNRLFLLAAALILAPGVGQAAGKDGETLYKACRACHLADGRGLPGAFPPLRGQILDLASREDGRTYLALVINRGLIGALEVGGKTYRGAMPAQGGLSNGDIATLLNYVVKDIAQKGGDTQSVNAFTEDEVKSALSAHPGVRSSAVLKLRPDLSQPATANPETPGPADNPKPAKEADGKPAPKKAAVTESDRRWAAHLDARGVSKADKK